MFAFISTPWTPRRFVWAMILLPAILIALWLLSLPFLFGMALLLAFSGTGAAAKIVVYIIYVGSFIPASAYNVLITAFAVSFIPKKKLRYVVFVPVSLVLATSVEMPAIWQWIIHPPQIEQSIARPTYPNPKGYLLVVYGHYMKDPLPYDVLATNPLASRIGIGWDEGCMCIYWTVTDSYLRRFSNDISNVTGLRSGSGGIFPPYFRVTTQPNQTSPYLADINIELRDGAEVAASLTQRGIPRYPDIEQRAKRGELFNRYFFSNIFHLLTHDTFWTPVIGSFINYYPQAAIRGFIRDAILQSN